MTLPDTRLDGKRVLVTGSSRGIGYDVAHTFARAGAKLVLSGRDCGALESTAETLRSECGAEAHVVAADLAAPDGPISLAEKSLGVLGGIDVLVNNAGISYPESVEALDTGHFDEVMQVNLRAPALLAARIGRAMAESGGGSIVTIASAAALRPLPEHYAYCTSKAGLIMATKVLALELGGRGVRANSICPTVVLTDMGQKVWGDSAKSAPMLARIPAGRFAVPSEVSATALWLASEASSMINGIDVPVDGGYLVS
ncbi:short-chain dehydrogenase [Rhodococcus sp. CUA-806]|jgi:NAD(P)-dependent dehydrogenase (short-subunit alcohol dehydrogenase family)|nr:short-chain dehydrogenase [Rhodococcus sp. CUA-806]